MLKRMNVPEVVHNVAGCAASCQKLLRRWPWRVAWRGRRHGVPVGEQREAITMVQHLHNRFAVLFANLQLATSSELLQRWVLGEAHLFDSATHIADF